MTFLKANNPLYADTDVNTELLETAMAKDTDLCECLVEQNDCDKQPIVDSDICVDSPVIASPDTAMENLVTAMHNLETQANQNGFTIYNVLYDDDCMFSSILYQLNGTGVCDFNSKQAVVDYLQANQARYYCNFACQPVDQHDD